MISSIKNVSKFFAYMGFIVLFLLMLWGVIGVISGIFKHTIPNIVELTEVMMPVAIFLPLAFTQLLKNHIKAEIVSQHFSPRMTEIAEIFILFLQFALLAVISWQTSLQAIRSIQVMETTCVTGFPVYLFPGKVATAFGTGIAAIVVFYQLIRESFHHKQTIDEVQ